MTKILKISKPHSQPEQTTRTPLRGRNRNNHTTISQIEPAKKRANTSTNSNTNQHRSKLAPGTDLPQTRHNSDNTQKIVNTRTNTQQNNAASKAASHFINKPRTSEDKSTRLTKEYLTGSPYQNKTIVESTTKTLYQDNSPYAKRKPTQQNDHDQPWKISSTYGKPKTERKQSDTDSTHENSPYSTNFSKKKNQEPRRHGKLRDENGRPIRVVAPRLAPLDAGIRLSKQLSDQGICSRREADEFIEKGWVTVNGTRATLGQRVLPTDKVQVAKQAEKAIDERVTILINKPVGLVSGQAEDGYAPAISLVVPENQWINDVEQISFEHKHLRGLAPAGRLDIDSVGLLVLTQDGRVAKALIGDKSHVDKEYLVRVEGELSTDGLKLLNHGLELDGIPLRPAKVTWQNEDQLRFILREGKKRQIRRMCELVGLNVIGLKRIRIGNVKLGDLPTGMWRYLREDECF